MWAAGVTIKSPVSGCLQVNSRLFTCLGKNHLLSVQCFFPPPENSCITWYIALATLTLLWPPTVQLELSKRNWMWHIYQTLSNDWIMWNGNKRTTLLAFASTLKAKCRTDPIKSNSLSVTSFYLITIAWQIFNSLLLPRLQWTQFILKAEIFFNDLLKSYGLEYLSQCGLTSLSMKLL